MGIIYIHWFQSLNICIKLMITNSHNEMGGGGILLFCFVVGSNYSWQIFIQFSCIICQCPYKLELFARVILMKLNNFVQIITNLV